ncbi:MAG: GntR family transcriptional regulator [Erysipelotrichaceae bacterium]|nr:GntR family transcriptional regulator [Erysipelotrichaceae bacterium]MBQ4342333.1 GntR family transcriptional regulator [Erysipelotrichaceae bacterium]
MNISYSHEDKDPIYLQIVKQMKIQMMNGTLRSGDALPSMRALASDLRVSVITTKRAYEELEKEGFIVSIVGKGCFVSDKPVTFIEQEQRRQFNQSLDQLVLCAKALHMSHDDLICELKKRGL